MRHPPSSTCSTIVMVSPSRWRITSIAKVSLILSDTRPGPEAAVKGCVGGRGVCSLLLSPPTLGLAWRLQQSGLQLDGEFAFYASRSRLRRKQTPRPAARPSTVLSWPGPKSAERGVGIKFPVQLCAPPTPPPGQARSRRQEA